MEIIFLGTSSGVPTKTRNVSGLAIRKAHSRRWSLVDCGEGTQQQILKTNLSLNKLQTIYITHVHGDHCYGLPGLLASASMSSRTDPLIIVAPSPIENFINATQECTDLKLSYEIIFVDVKDTTVGVSSPAIDVQEFDVQSIELSHRVPSYAYAFSEKNVVRKLNHVKLMQEDIEPGPEWSQIQKAETVTLSDGRIVNGNDYLLPERVPRKIVVAGDNDCPELLAQAASSANVLVHEATYTEEVAKKVGAGPQHSYAGLVAKFAEKTAIPHLILTHFSARYHDSLDISSSIMEVEDEARQYYSGTLFLANDFDVYQLNVQAELCKL